MLEVLTDIEIHLTEGNHLLIEPVEIESKKENSTKISKKRKAKVHLQQFPTSFSSHINTLNMWDYSRHDQTVLSWLRDMEKD